MEHDKSVSFSGKAGDVTSIDDISKRAGQAIDMPPAEALIKSQEKSTSKDRHIATHEFKSLFNQMRKGPLAKRILLLITGALAVLSCSVIGEIRMNVWQGAFYRAIQNKDLTAVGTQVLIFLVIVAVMLPLVVVHNFLLERMKIRLREWLTNHLLDQWNKPGLAYRLNITTEESLNPDQRIQEDARSFSDMSGDLGMGAFRSSLMLISFIGILWVMSEGITLNIGPHFFIIPGYMVWFAIIYALIGSWAAARGGAPLITLNEDRYTREANFRYSLVRINENAESIAFYSGENDERKIANKTLNTLLQLLRRLSFANAKLTSITCGHGWLVVILPIIVAYPGYAQGKLDWGGLMMVVGAFNQVQQSLRWFVENFGRIADWRAAMHRVISFQEAVSTVDEYENSPEIIEILPSENGNLAFEKTGVSLMDGQIVIADATAQIAPGERVLLGGESGSGKSTLLRAVGGLWPWGSGKIYLPPKEQMMFLPQRPYIPLGTLADAITYPKSVEKADPEKIKECLIRVNLESFIPMLDQTERWDKLMSLGQQQRLAFARLLLHRPQWIFLDEATSALDDDNQHRMMSLFTEELSTSALLSVGHRTGLEQYHTRTLTLVQGKTGRVLSKKPKPAFVPKKGLLERLAEALVKTTETVE